MGIEKNIENLKNYIRIDRENIVYDDSDFSKFCRSHCEDIQAVLDELQYEKEKNKLLKDLSLQDTDTLQKQGKIMEIYNKNYISKDKIKEILYKDFGETIYDYHYAYEKLFNDIENLLEEE